MRVEIFYKLHVGHSEPDRVAETLDVAPLQVFIKTDPLNQHAVVGLKIGDFGVRCDSLLADDPRGMAALKAVFLYALDNAALLRDLLKGELNAQKG